MMEMVSVMTVIHPFDPSPETSVTIRTILKYLDVCPQDYDPEQGNQDGIDE